MVLQLFLHRARFLYTKLQQLLQPYPLMKQSPGHLLVVLIHSLCHFQVQYFHSSHSEILKHPLILVPITFTTSRLEHETPSTTQLTSLWQLPFLIHLNFPRQAATRQFRPHLCPLSDRCFEAIGQCLSSTSQSSNVSATAWGRSIGAMWPASEITSNTACGAKFCMAWCWATGAQRS